MTIALKYDKDTDILRITTGEVFTAPEFESSLNEILDSDNFPPDIKTIWDLTRLDFSKIDSNFETSLIQILRENPRRENALTAIVVASDIGFGMSRMFQTLSTQKDLPQRFSIFSNLIAAEEWLVRPSPV